MSKPGGNPESDSNNMERESCGSTSGEESDDESRDEEATGPAELSQDYQYCQAVAEDSGDVAPHAETADSSSGGGDASMMGRRQGSLFNRNGTVAESLFAAQQCFTISNNKSATSTPAQLCQPIGVAGTKRTRDEMNGFALPMNGYHPSERNAQFDNLRVAQRHLADLGGQHRSLHQGGPARNGADLLQQPITPVTVNYRRPMGFGGQLGLEPGRNPDDNLMRELDEADQGGDLPTYLQNIARRRQIEDESLQRFFHKRASQLRGTEAADYGGEGGMAASNQSGMDPNFIRMASQESSSSTAQAPVEMAMNQYAGNQPGGNPDIAALPVPQGKSQEHMFCLPVQAAPLSRANSRSDDDSPVHPLATSADKSKRSPAETDHAAAASLLSLSAKDDEVQPAKKAKVDAQQQMPQVLKGDRTENQCMPLLRPEEREDFKTTDYLFYVVSHFRVCHFEEKDRGGGKRKGLELGFPGLCCSFCGGKKVGSLGRYFIQNQKTFADKSKSIDAFYTHLVRCKHVPQTVKEDVQRYKENHTKDTENLRAKGVRKSAKFFFATLWARLQAAPSPNTNQEVVTNMGDDSKSSTDIMPNAGDGTGAMFNGYQSPIMRPPFYQGAYGAFPGFTSNQAAILQMSRQIMPMSAMNIYQSNPDLMRRMLLNRYQTLRLNSGALQQSSPAPPRPPGERDNSKSGSAHAAVK